MNYYTDCPIDKCEEDLLSRREFSRNLSSSIYNYEYDEGLVIGLFGKWGSGKTSVINMVTEELKQIVVGEENRNKKKPIIVNFNPWNYPKHGDLMMLFLHNLRSRICKEEGITKKKIGEIMSEYTEALELCTLVPIIGSALTPVLKVLFGNLGKKLKNNKELNEIRKQIEDELKAQGQTIVVVIDDIDRLTNTQIIDILHLVKSVADFPRIIYILSMDRDIVADALTSELHVDGNRYLEKIVQVQFNIPEVGHGILENIMKEKLIADAKVISREVEIDNTYLSEILRCVVYPYIRTIRDVNRLLNTFRFKYGALYKETSLEDMIGITTIELFEPKLYHWIYNNGDILCNEYKYDEEYKSAEEYETWFQKIGIDGKRAIEILYAMFPAFVEKVNNKDNIRESKKEKIVRNMRISYSERFELYFCLNIDRIDIPLRSDINKFLNILEYSDMKKMIYNNVNQQNLRPFIEEIKYLIAYVENTRSSVVLNCLFILKTKYTDIVSENTMDPCIVKLIKKMIKATEWKALLSDIIHNAELMELGEVAYWIEQIDKDYKGNKSKFFEGLESNIMEEDLNEIYKKYVNRFCDVIKDESVLNVLDMYKFCNSFDLLKKFNIEEADKYKEKIWKDEIQVLKFICKIAAIEIGNEWIFSEPNYIKYISKDEIGYKIRENKTRFDEFTDLERKQLNSFELGE